MLRQSELYLQLIGVDDRTEGNSLEHTDDSTSASQYLFHIWAITMAQEHAERTTLNVLEIGHNKGLFGLILNLIATGSTLVAIDIDERSQHAAQLLNEYTGISVDFHHGASVEILDSLIENKHSFDYAWVDGSHTEYDTIIDLERCSTLNIPYIAVDDTSQKRVQNAVRQWVENHPYREIPNPYISTDKRKARLFQRQ